MNTVQLEQLVIAFCARVSNSFASDESWSKLMPSFEMSPDRGAAPRVAKFAACSASVTSPSISFKSFRVVSISGACASRDACSSSALPLCSFRRATYCVEYSNTRSASAFRIACCLPACGSSFSKTSLISFFKSSKLSGPAVDSFCSTLRISRLACCCLFNSSASSFAFFSSSSFFFRFSSSSFAFFSMSSLRFSLPASNFASWIFFNSACSFSRRNSRFRASSSSLFRISSSFCFLISSADNLGPSSSFFSVASPTASSLSSSTFSSDFLSSLSEPEAFLSSGSSLSFFSSLLSSVLFSSFLDSFPSLLSSGDSFAG
mmetsp:Transcript_76413/g.120283  ORF Transcript_76413/g.120283 Transcript_76413/m.120283 type:complete len:318 (-) Transcript_76413:677-1630(-)